MTDKQRAKLYDSVIHLVDKGSLGDVKHVATIALKGLTVSAQISAFVAAIAGAKELEVVLRYFTKLDEERQKLDKGE